MSRRLQLCRVGEIVPAALRGAVVAIGNFDGVHRGHQHLIAVAREVGSRRGAPNAVLTFDPHPRAFFNPEARLFLLTPDCVKIDVMRHLDLDGVVIRRFDAALAALSAEAFVDRFLVEDLGVAGVVVGHDFHFGHARQGTPARLQTLCDERDLSCSIVSPVCYEGCTVSSSAIRAHLEQGEIAAANALLGYRWFVRSEVRHGDKRGRQLGYPTANLRLPEGNRLRHGIYAVRIRIGGSVHEGVASHGRRPTFDNGAPLLEVHLFDFGGDLYGQILDVEFAAWIRGEERFENAEALVARMDRDAEEARSVLALDRTRSLIASPEG